MKVDYDQEVRACTRKCTNLLGFVVCFPGSAELTVKEVRNVEEKNSTGTGSSIKTEEKIIQKKMADVSMDDLVLTGEGKFCKLSCWLHREKDEIVENSYVKITAADGDSVTLSKNHLIFDASVGEDGDYVEAQDLVEKRSVVKKLTMQKFENIERMTSMPSLSRVEKIEMLERETGMYAPLTECASVVVNGVVCSCYAWMLNDSNGIGETLKMVIRDDSHKAAEKSSKSSERSMKSLKKITDFDSASTTRGKHRGFNNSSKNSRRCTDARACATIAPPQVNKQTALYYANLPVRVMCKVRDWFGLDKEENKVAFSTNKMSEFLDNFSFPDHVIVGPIGSPVGSIASTAVPESAIGA